MTDKAYIEALEAEIARHKRQIAYLRSEIRRVKPAEVKISHNYTRFGLGFVPCYVRTDKNGRVLSVGEIKDCPCEACAAAAGLRNVTPERNLL